MRSAPLFEWYDFFLYSTVTPLVFAKLFFPNSDPLVGTLQAFLVYFVGFLARPIGAFIFGHFGEPSRSQGGIDLDSVSYGNCHIPGRICPRLITSLESGEQSS
jgi:MFS family permease